MAILLYKEAAKLDVSFAVSWFRVEALVVSEVNCFKNNE